MGEKSIPSKRERSRPSLSFLVFFFFFFGLFVFRFPFKQIISLLMQTMLAIRAILGSSSYVEVFSRPIKERFISAYLGRAKRMGGG